VSARISVGTPTILDQVRPMFLRRFSTEIRRQCVKYGLCLLVLYELQCIIIIMGPGISVAIANGYGLDGSGIESRWGRDFPHLSRPALGHTQPPVQWVPGISRRVKTGQSVTLTPHTLLVPWSRNSRAILLPLWAVRSVESLIACTRVLFTLFL